MTTAATPSSATDRAWRWEEALMERWAMVTSVAAADLVPDGETEHQERGDLDAAGGAGAAAADEHQDVGHHKGLR